MLRGEIAMSGQLRPAGNAWRGQFNVRSAGGGLKNSPQARREMLSYDNLELDVGFDPRRINAELDTAFNRPRSTRPATSDWPKIVAEIGPPVVLGSYAKNVKGSCRRRGAGVRCQVSGVGCRGFLAES